MDILVCFQVVPDLSSAHEEDWERIRVAPVDGLFPRVFDCFDEAALEVARGLRDEFAAAGEPVQLRAVTLSTVNDDRLSEKLFALGYDSVTRLEFDVGYLSMPNAKAVILADYIRKAGIPDFTFCGIQSGICGSRLTGPMIAELLRLPCISDVSGVWRSPDDGLHVQMICDGVRSTGRIFGKAMLLVGNSERGLLRIPTLKARLAVKGSRAEVVDAGIMNYDAMIHVSGKAGHEEAAQEKPLMTAGIINYTECVPSSTRRRQSRGKCRYIEGDVKTKSGRILDIIKGGDT